MTHICHNLTIDNLQVKRPLSICMSVWPLCVATVQCAWTGVCVATISRA